MADVVDSAVTPKRTAERPTLLTPGKIAHEGTAVPSNPTAQSSATVLATTTTINGNTDASASPRDIYTIQCQPRNEELQAAVKESCGAIYPLQQELKGIMAEWQARWNSWAENNAKQFRTFDEELTYYSKNPYAEAELDESYACFFKSDWLEQYLRRIKAVQKASEEEKAKEAQKEAEAKARRFEGLSEEEAEMLRKEMEAIAEEAEENQPPLSPNSHKKMTASNNRRISFAGLHEDLSRLFFGPVKRSNVTKAVADVNETLFPFEGHTLVDLTMQTHDNGQADPLSLLRAEFSKSLAVVAANETQLTTMGDERDGFITQERVAEAEAKTRDMVDLYTDTLHIVYSRFRQAITAGVDVGEFVDHVSGVALGVDTHGKNARQEAEETKEKGQQDLASLREFLKKTRETSRQARELFESRREDSNNKIKNNTSAQQHAWATILGELQRLKELCVEREELIGDRMLATEKEQERLRHTSEVEEMCLAREDDLLALLDNAKQALEYVDSVGKLSEFVQTSVKEKSFPEKLLKYQIEEGLRFADVYKRYALFAGRALFLRQQRLENIRRLVRATEFQIQSAAETLDADLPSYRSQLVAYKGTEEALKSESAGLSEQMAKEAGLWDEVETFLDEQRVIVEAPPSLAVQELQRDLMKSHVAAVDVLASTEQRLLDSDKAHVRRMNNACVAAKEVIQEKHRHRSTIAAAAANNASGASPSPLSPAAGRTQSETPYSVKRAGGADEESAIDASAIAASPIDYN